MKSFARVCSSHLCESAPIHPHQTLAHFFIHLPTPQSLHSFPLLGFDDPSLTSSLPHQVNQTSLLLLLLSLNFFSLLPGKGKVCALFNTKQPTFLIPLPHLPSAADQLCSFKFWFRAEKVFKSVAMLDHTASRPSSNPTCPNLPDLEERMQMVLLSNAAEDQNNYAGESFAQRAEWYYHKRPQLLALLQDLHNSYLTLLDRFHHSQRKQLGKGTDSPVDGEKEDGSYWSENSQVIDSEAESCLAVSCPRQQEQVYGVDEQLIGEILAKDVQNDVLVHHLMEMDRHWKESGRKIELLKKLLELLETERLMLSEDNARLGYKVNTLLEENKAIHSDAMIMKRKALELGRSMLKMREDYRVCMLSQKIRDLQQQIHLLEKRNDEYHQQLMKRDDVDRSKEHKASGFNEKSLIGARQVRLVGCFQMETLKFKRRSDVAAKRGGGKLGKKWWEKGRMKDLFMCGLNCTNTST